MSNVELSVSVSSVGMSVCVSVCVFVSQFGVSQLVSSGVLLV